MVYKSVKLKALKKIRKLCRLQIVIICEIGEICGWYHAVLGAVLVEALEVTVPAFCLRAPISPACLD